MHVNITLTIGELSSDERDAAAALGAMRSAGSGGVERLGSEASTSCIGGDEAGDEDDPMAVFTPPCVEPRAPSDLTGLLARMSAGTPPYGLPARAGSGGNARGIPPRPPGSGGGARLGGQPDNTLPSAPGYAT